MDRVVPALRVRDAACAALGLLCIACLAFPLLPAHAQSVSWPPIGQWVGNAPYHVAAHGDYVCAGGMVGVTMIDVSVPSQPLPLGYYHTGRSTTCVALDERYAYVGVSQKMYVLDIADPCNPIATGSVELPWWTLGDVVVSGAYAYVTVYKGSMGGLSVIDVSDPEYPTEVGHLDLPPWASDVAVSGGYAYIAGGDSGMWILDVSNPADPIPVGHVLVTADHIEASGGYVFVSAYDLGSYTGGLWVIDASDPRTARILGYAETPFGVRDMAAAGGHVYLNHPITGVIVVDVSNPASPTQVGCWSDGGYPFSLAVSAPYLYVGDLRNGLLVLDVADPSLPVLLGSSGITPDPAAVAAAGGFAYVANGTSGLRVLDVADPTAPLEVGACEGPASGVCVAAGYAYVGGTGYRLSIVNISDPARPIREGSWYSRYYIHGVAVAGPYAYVAAGSALWVLDVSDPREPVAVGSWATSKTAWDVAVSGKYAYVACSGALRVLDISDPAHPVEVGAVSVGAQSVAVSGAYAYVGREDSALRVIDVSNPANPLVLGTLPGSLVYDVAIGGDYAYVAAGAHGLIVADVRDPWHPVEVAYWDTPGLARGVAAVGGYVYLADKDWGVLIFREYEVGHLAGQVRVRGTTTNIEGATVKAYLDGELQRTAATGADGIYTMEYVRPGEYVMVASKPGYISQTKAHIVVGPGQTTYVNFGLEASGRIMGQVRVRGTAVNIENATVAAYLDGRLKAMTTTNEQGMYVMESNLPTGMYTVCATKPGYREQTKGPVSVVAGEVTYVNFGLERIVRLTGQVRDRNTGLALIGAAINAYVYPANTSIAGTTTTQAPYGIYEFHEELPAGTYNVAASMPGYLRQMKSKVIVSEDETAYCNFALAPSGILKGQVRDRTTGAPLIGAAVTMYTYPANVEVARTITKSPYGIYEVNQNMPTGVYRVAAVTGGYWGQSKASISIIAGEITYVNFGLQRIVRLKGQVKERDTGLPLVGAAVHVYSYPQGTFVAATVAQPPYGIYEFPAALPPGVYAVTADALGYAPQTKANVVVTESDTTYRNFALDLSGAIYGWVSYGSLRLVGAAVTMYLQPGDVRVAETVTGSLGVYEIRDDLPAGTYTVVASMPGYITQAKSNIIISAGAYTFCDFSLAPYVLTAGRSGNGADLPPGARTLRRARSARVSPARMAKSIGHPARPPT